MSKRVWFAPIVAFLLSAILELLHPACAQQYGRVLKIYHWANPATMSIHDEAGYSTSVTSMAVFNNLVLYKQDVAQNSLASIVPDLATEWFWNKDRTELSFRRACRKVFPRAICEGVALC